MKVLAIDTSNKAMAVGLADQGVVVGVKKLNIKRNHSIQLMPAIKDLLAQVGWKPKEIDRIAVANGPGSYTGVRIAVTTAKSLAWALNCDLVAYSSLKALILGKSHLPGQLICPLFDARRENVYTGLYKVSEDFTITQLKADTHVALTDWLVDLKELNQPILFIGEDVKHFKEAIQDTLASNFLYSLQLDHLPQVEAMALDAPNEVAVAVHQLTPDYLKRTEAEENWMKDNPDHKRGPLVEKVETKNQ